MKNLRVANRYAKAFYSIAEEQDFSLQAYEDMQLVYNVFSTTKELKIVLQNPIVRINKKLNILKGVFENKIHPVSLHYLTIVIRKKRAALIEGIAYEFLKVHKRSLNIATVTLITASEVKEDIHSKAMVIARNLTGMEKIEFHEKIQPEIIGGFVLMIGDLRYDASIKRKLAKIKNHLLAE